VGDKLRTHRFNSGTTGLVDVSQTDDPYTAVCLLPGTEVAFDECIRTSAWLLNDTKYHTAIFRQTDMNNTIIHHDALELPNGAIHKLNSLAPNQYATVLQLPAQPKTEAEAIEVKQTEFV